MGRPRNFVVWTVLSTLLSLVFPVLGTAITGILLTEMGHKADTSHYPRLAAGILS